MTELSAVCVFCDEPVTAEDREGQAVGSIDAHGASSLHRTHYECGLRCVLGGIGHLTNHAHWCLEEHDPDAGLSYRDSARQVLAMVEEFGGEEVVRRSFPEGQGDG